MSQPKDFVSHLRKYHPRNPNAVDCIADNCSLLLLSVPQFLKHWYSKHHVAKPKLQSTATMCQEGQNVFSSSSTQSDSSLMQVNEDQVLPKPGPSQEVSAMNFFFDSHSVGRVNCDSDSSSDSDSDSDSVDMCHEVMTELMEDTGPTSIIGDHQISAGSSQMQQGKATSSPSDSSQATVGIREKAGMFVLNLKVNNATTTKSAMSVIQETQTLIKDSMKELISDIKDRNLSLNDAAALENLIREKSEIFSHVNTKDKQEKYFKEKFQVVNPCTRNIHHEFRTVGSGSKKKTKIVEFSAQYIPVKNLLEKIVNNPHFDKLCSDYVMCDDPEILDCFMKSESAKNNPIIRDHPNALRLVIYFDELEVCNPLGSASNKHKVGAFYIFLDNIGPLHRSRLDLICLLLIVNSQLLKVESGAGLGIDKVLEEFVTDLKDLEDGITLKSGKTLYATVIACVGDNLGIHTVAGLKEGFTAHRPCRVCMVTETERTCLVKEDPSLLRTEEQWKEQCARIEAARTKKEKEALMVEFGVKRLTVFSQLKSFSLTSGFPPDIVHDLLEGGSISIEIFCLLNHILKSDLYPELSLFVINERLKYFDYGHADKLNKPAEIKKDHLEEGGHLRQKASQMWELATILPFVLAPDIRKDDENWDNFMLLLEVSRMVFSPVIKKNMLPYMEDCIELYLTNFKRLYGLHLTPKQHYLTHYPSLIKIYGPLVNFWTMRCEAKHKWFKKLVYILGNYKNIEKSLAVKHQKRQAAVYWRGLPKEEKYGPLKKIQVCDAPYKKLFPLHETVLEANWMEVNGIVFKPGQSFVPIRFLEDEDIPEFLFVVHTLAWPQILVCQVVKTKDYDCQLGSYEVEVLDQLVTCEINSILGHRVVHAYTVQDRKFIASKVCFGGSSF